MGVVYEIYQLEVSCTEFIPGTTKPTEYDAGRVENVYKKNRGNSSLCSHSKHTSVPADY